MERQPQRPASRLAVLMVDGWRVAGAKKEDQENAGGLARNEDGVFYWHEQSARKEAGRGLIEDKIIVHGQGDALELGQRLNWEALRGGSGWARKVPRFWAMARPGLVGLLPWQPASLESGAEHSGEEEPGLRQWGRNLVCINCATEGRETCWAKLPP